MAEFEIIDVHTHLARTFEEEAVQWPFPGRRACDRWGTPERAVEYMARNGISKMVFLNIPPREYRGPLVEKAKLAGLTEDQRKKELDRIGERIAPKMREINEWGCEVGHRFPQLLPFSCISPELGGTEGIVREVELRASHGARGIKLHPAMFFFFPNDEVMWPAYEKCQELGLPVLADSGPWPASHALIEFSAPAQDIRSKVIDYGEPLHWAKVAEAFPHLTIILAHLGAAWWDERVELAQRYPNVYFGTAQGFCAADRIPFSPHRGLAEEDAPRILRKIGVERILFGTDSMLLPLQPQMEQILRLPLTEEEKRMIMAGNAKRLLRL